METQACYAIPEEDGRMNLYSCVRGGCVWLWLWLLSSVPHSASQWPRGVQMTIAEVLGIPNSKVDVNVKRVSGGCDLA